MKGFCSLASGSKGNAYFLGSSKAKILIDAGISVKAIKERLAKLNIDLSEIEAILISHEHADHIKAIATLAGRYQIPIFANSDTAKAICSTTKMRPKFKIFTTGETFVFKDLEIHPFSVQHDTLDPVAFTFQLDSIKLGICTDLGFATSLVQSHLQNCDYLFLEANHDPLLVHACARPMVYKRRVLSRQGHLSNEACANLLQAVLHTKLKKVILAHLSSECNRPDLAIQTIKQHLGDSIDSVSLSVALQECISEIIKF